MSNIEDDVKILEKFKNNEMQRDKLERDNRCGGWKIGDIYKHLELNTAIQNILAEREQKDKRIKELEEERQLVGIPVRNKRDGKIGIVLHQWENGSIAVLERINPRIINTHDSWNTLEIITDEVKQVQTQDDTISKQVVIDKIKELKKRKNKYEYETQEIFANAYYDRKRLEIIHKIDILQELLEGERK